MTIALERLLAQGEVYVDPSSIVVWEKADPQRPWLPAHMVSVAGLPREAMLRLSRLDLGRVAASAAWLKTVMAARSSESSTAGPMSAEARLALQETREECGHALMLLRLAEYAGLDAQAMARDFAGLRGLIARMSPEGLAYWAWMYLAEAVSDALVLQALREGEELCPVARQVMQLHHREQTRRAAVSKTMLSKRIADAGRLRRRAVAMLLPMVLRRYLRTMLFPDAGTLATAGVAEPLATAYALWNDPARRALGGGCAAAAVTTLRRNGLPIRAGASYPW